MANLKDIKYINKEFASLKETLIAYTKTYFPNTYNDFSPSSTGMLFIEMAAYVGDVLSFYIDNQVQETFIQYARQKENLYNLAYLLGYRPKVTTISSTIIDFYQQVPAITSGSVTIPDFSYCLKINKNAQISSNLNNNVKFLLEDDIDFSFSSSYDPTEVSIYQISGLSPTFYLLKKSRKATSSTINTLDVVINEPKKFETVEINDSNIVGILDIVDSDNNIWYEVPSLAQDFIYNYIDNKNSNNPSYDNNEEVNQILKLKSVPKRFTTRFLNDSTLQLQFGSGVTNESDEEIVPNADNVGLGLPSERVKLTTAYSPLNFIFTNSYGTAPSNTTLTIRYLTGGGIQSNVPQNTLTLLDTTNVSFLNSTLNSTLAQSVFDSVACSNPLAADGGGDGDDINELRNNALGNFQNQLRTVTNEDYVIRALSMPASLGSIAKIYSEKEKFQDNTDNKFSSIVLYILSYDNNKKLRQASTLIKQNLKTYLSQYRMINDYVKIRDAFVINIGINFDVITLPNFNNNEVILKCIDALTEFFNIDKWQINQPIILRDLYVLLDRIEGVQTIKHIEITNKTGASDGYSEYAYDIPGALKNNIVYPSLDPMIFEVKNPELDIKGRTVSL